MNLKRISAEFSVCKLSGPADLGKLEHKVRVSGFLGKTDQEVSLVCETPFGSPRIQKKGKTAFWHSALKGVPGFFPYWDII